MLEPKIALTLLMLIFITTCQSFENTDHEFELNPKDGSIEENLQTWKFKDGYLINKQLGKKYSYGNITWSLEPPKSKSYFHIVGKHYQCPKYISCFTIVMIFNYNLELDIHFESIQSIHAESFSLTGQKDIQATKSTCKTVSGPVPNATCIFPVKIAGITYSSCVIGGDYNDWKYWCPIKVDASGVYEYSSEDPDTWGDCASDCQTVDTPLGK